MGLIPMNPTQIDYHASYHSPLHPLRIMGLSAKVFTAGALAQLDGESYTSASLVPALIFDTG